MCKPEPSPTTRQCPVNKARRRLKMNTTETSSLHKCKAECFEGLWAYHVTFVSPHFKYASSAAGMSIYILLVLIVRKPIGITHWMMKSRMRAPISVDPVTPRLPMRNAGMGQLEIGLSDQYKSCASLSKLWMSWILLYPLCS